MRIRIRLFLINNLPGICYTLIYSNNENLVFSEAGVFPHHHRPDALQIKHACVKEDIEHLRFTQRQSWQAYILVYSAQAA